MKIYASRNSGGFTLGMLNDVSLGSTKAVIYDHDEVGDAQVVFDGYLDLAIKTYPELADCVVTYLQASGANRLSIDIQGATFDYTPAW